jgi:hypothetical protein
MNEPIAPPPSETPRVPRGAALRHLLLSIALWATYVIYWRVVLARGLAPEAPLSFLILALFALLQFGLTQGWIAHNRGLAHRHAGRRRRRALTQLPADEDFLGRHFVLPSEAELRQAARVVVRLDGDQKVFEVATPPSEFWSGGPT